MRVSAGVEHRACTHAAVSICTDLVRRQHTHDRSSFLVSTRSGGAHRREDRSDAAMRHEPRMIGVLAMLNVVHDVIRHLLVRFNVQRRHAQIELASQHHRLHARPLARRIGDVEGLVHVGRHRNVDVHVRELAGKLAPQAALPVECLHVHVAERAQVVVRPGPGRNDTGVGTWLVLGLKTHTAQKTIRTSVESL